MNKAIIVHGDVVTRWAVWHRDFWLGRSGPEAVPSAACLFETAADAGAFLVEYALRGVAQSLITVASARGYRLIPLTEVRREWRYDEPG